MNNENHPWPWFSSLSCAIVASTSQVSSHRIAHYPTHTCARIFVTILLQQDVTRTWNSNVLSPEGNNNPTPHTCLPHSCGTNGTPHCFKGTPHPHHPNAPYATHIVVWSHYIDVKVWYFKCNAPAKWRNKSRAMINELWIRLTLRGKCKSSDCIYKLQVAHLS